MLCFDVNKKRNGSWHRRLGGGRLILSIVGLVLVSYPFCQNAVIIANPSPDITRTAKRVSRVGDARLRSFYFPASKWDVKYFSISPDSRYIAIGLEQKTYGSGTGLYVYSLKTGKRILKLGIDELTSGPFAWQQNNAILAASGGNQGDVLSGGSHGGILLLDMTTRKHRNREPLPINAVVNIAWMPDGRHIITAESDVVDFTNGRVNGAEGLMPRGSSAQTVSMSSKWTVAMDAGIGDGIEIYRRVGKSIRSYKHISSISSPTGSDSHGFATRPMFLKNGDLAYLYWRGMRPRDLGRKLSRGLSIPLAKADVWLADQFGRKSRFLIRLPDAQQGKRGESQFSLSGDGKMIAYLRGDSLCIDRIR